MVLSFGYLVVIQQAGVCNQPLYPPNQRVSQRVENTMC